MLSIEACKKILQQNGVTYNDEDVKKIRHLLYKLGELDYQLYKAPKSKHNGKCTSLRKS